MKKNYFSLGVCMMLALFFSATGHAEELSKRGSFTLVFGWTVTSGDTIAVAEDHLVWGGVAPGSLRNEAGSGFLHGAAGTCTFAGEFRKDVVTKNGGDCVATDRDGDKVAMAWKCTTCPTAGEFEWTGGTGKYAGIKGRGTFTQNDAGPQGGVVGWSVWKGQWALP